MIVFVIICICVLLTGAFWKDILVWAAPKIVLSSALSGTLEELKTRMEGSPLSILGNVFDENARYTIDMDLDTTDALLGNVDYNMNIQTDGANHQVFAEGQVTLNETILDMSLYFNDEFACLTSETLLNDSFYGITYDTFSSDIRSSKILPYLIGKEKLTEWETSVSKLQAQMEQDRTVNLPEITEEELHALILGIITLKAEVAAESLMIDNESVKTHKISFSADGAQISTALNYLLQEGVIDEASSLATTWDYPSTTLSVSFWIYQDSILKIVCEATSEDTAYSAEVTLGENAAADTLSFRSAATQGTDTQIFSAVSDAANTPDGYTETLSIAKSTDGVEKKYVIDYDWSKESGDMSLTVTKDSQCIPLQLNFSENEDGFRLATDDFESFTELFDRNDRKEGRASSCIMTVSKGSSISTPEYKNLDDWSMEDLLALLSGIGSLLGLNL